MTSKAIDWETVRKVSADAARKVARNYPGIDPEDIEQAIYVRVLEQEATFKRMNYTPGGMFALFVKYGTKYANDERVSALHFSDQYHYTAKEIRALCAEALFDRDAFLERLFDDTFSTDPEEVLARVVDLTTAFNEASDADRTLIKRRFVNNETLTPAESRAMYRALDRITMGINRAKSQRRTNHDGPGSRVAVTNATANTMTRKAYE